jgi:1-acyl-sn-glycerol-3-phosphate acyltransferase
MQAAAEGLRRGMILVIFPEGSRSIDGTVREFRRGATILANRLQVPIVPVGIWGAFRVWPRQGKLRRHPVALCFGEPLAPDPEAGDQALLETLRDRVVGLVDEAADMVERAG